MDLFRNTFDLVGSAMRLEVLTLRGRPGGPSLAVTGSIHGDELEGALILSRLARSLANTDMQGELILVPISNPEAVAASTRTSPIDGKNLARCFPGSADQTYTGALAALLREHVLSKATHFVDLHSAGVAMSCPFFAGYVGSPSPASAESRRMAIAFGPDLVWRHDPPFPPGRTISIAETRGIPAIYVEAEGGLFPSSDILTSYEDGVLRVMCALGMISDVPQHDRRARFVVGQGDIDSPSCEAQVSGLLTAHVSGGDPVAAGEHCFTVTDLDGTVIDTVLAPASGVVTFLRRSRWVTAGDLLITLANPDPLES